MVQLIPTRATLLPLLPLLLGACSGDGSEQDPDGGTQGGLVGVFKIELDETGSTKLLGSVFDGATPSAYVWEEAAKAGTCRLLKPRTPYCSKACGSDAVCTEDETCTSYPTPVSVGTVQVKGVKTKAGQTSFKMDPINNNYQPSGGVSLAYPPFAEGDAVELSAAAFTITAKGIAPLELKSAPIQLDAGKSATLSWTAPTKATSAKIKVKLDLSHHGGSNGKIECEAEDKGSLELPATLLDQLQKLGVAGFPTIVVTREVVDSAPQAVGEVDLVLDSSVEQEVKIPGLTSCNDDSQCPSGQTCHKSKLKCE